MQAVNFSVALFTAFPSDASCLGMTREKHYNNEKLHFKERRTRGSFGARFSRHCFSTNTGCRLHLLQGIFPYLTQLSISLKLPTANCQLPTANCQLPIPYSHLKNFAVNAYTATPQASNTSICGQQLQNEEPSKATFRRASLRAVSGRNCNTG
jgi:hypothetical protein